MTSDKGGRPPIGRRFTLRLDEPTRAEIERLASEQGVKVADVVRDLIAQALKGRTP